MSENLGLQIQQYTPPKGQLSLWWQHQASFVMKLGGKTIAIDLFLTDIPQRVFPPMMKPEDFRDVDYFLGTHDHVDHIDRAVWPALAKACPNAKFIVPAYHLETLRKELDIPAERLVGVGMNTPFEEDGLKITALPSAHELLEQDPVTGEYSAVGYVIDYDGFKIYHSGDCCVYEGLETNLKKQGKLDVMMLPITGRCANRYRNNIIGNMTYQEAVDLAGAVKPNLVIPMHYDCFSGNLENPLLFKDFLNVKYPDVPCGLPQAGVRFDITK